MKKIPVITCVLLLFLSTIVNAGIQLSGMTAEAWQSSSETQKVSYLAGTFDAWSVNGFKFKGVEISTQLSFDQYINAITTYYKDTRNSNIPVQVLIYIINLEMNGADKKLIDDELASARKSFAS